MVLSIWKNVGALFFKLITFIYRTIAKLYNAMCYDFAGLDSKVYDSLSSILDSLYILIAIFMLFRITITLIQYLIDPDRVSDKNMGAGKLIIRIIISLLLVISFQAIIVPKTYELQEALLAKGGFIMNLFGGSDQEQGNNSSSSPGLVIEIQKKYYGLNSTSSNINGIVNDINSKGHCQVGTPNVVVSGSGSHTYNDSYFITQIYLDIGNRLEETTINDKCNVSIVVSPNEKDGTNAASKFESYDIKDTDGASFAKKILAVFADESDYSEIINSEVLESYEGDNEMAKKVEQEEVNIDLFVALIFGIVIICFLIILCLEVIVRSFKIILLQLLAPIAFISYMNPNDKVLENWFKKYIGTYLDLFIKLVAIQFGLVLMNLITKILDSNNNLILTIVYYLAIFVFMKTVPNIISDIFGLKNMGGTFKDSMNTLKTAALTGAGAIAGAGAGVISGLGKGGSFSTAIGGLFGGAARGAISGSKGKVLQGAKTQMNKNAAVKDAKANGSNWWDRQKANLGFSVTGNDDKKIQELEKTAKQHDAVGNYADKAKKHILGELDKGKGDKLAESKYAKIYRSEMDKYQKLQEIEKEVTTNKSRFINTKAQAEANIAYNNKLSEYQAKQDEMKKLDEARNIDRNNYPKGSFGDARYNAAKLDADNLYQQRLEQFKLEEKEIQKELVDLDAKRHSDFYDQEAHQKAIEEAKKETELQRQKIYVDFEGDGSGSLVDKAVKEYNDINVNKPLGDGDIELQNMAKEFEGEQKAYGDVLDDVNVYSWDTVKKGKDTHSARASQARSEATSIKESDKYKGEKASQDQSKNH